MVWDKKYHIQKWLDFYAIPLIITIVCFIPFFNFSGSELYSSLTGIYVLYITITTLILSITFVVISIAPTMMQKELTPYGTPVSTSFLDSIRLLYVNLRILYFCFLGIIFSLIGYIFTTVHFLSDILLKGLFCVDTFFTTASLFGLALLTGMLMKKIKAS
jgi:hypothetical protein